MMGCRMLEGVEEECVYLTGLSVGEDKGHSGVPPSHHSDSPTTSSFFLVAKMNAAHVHVTMSAG